MSSHSTAPVMLFFFAHWHSIISTAYGALQGHGLPERCVEFSHQPTRFQATCSHYLCHARAPSHHQQRSVVENILVTVIVWYRVCILQPIPSFCDLSPNRQLWSYIIVYHRHRHRLFPSASVLPSPVAYFVCIVSFYGLSGFESPSAPATSSWYGFCVFRVFYMVVYP